MLIKSSLFDLDKSIFFWKVVYTVNVINKETTNSAPLVFKMNQLPTKGSCSVDLDEGTELETYFTISCQNWLDLDGDIDVYEYYGNYFYIFK